MEGLSTHSQLAEQESDKSRLVELDFQARMLASCIMTEILTSLTVRRSTAIKDELVAFHMCLVSRSEKPFFVERSFGGFFVVQVTVAECSAFMFFVLGKQTWKLTVT